MLDYSHAPVSAIAPWSDSQRSHSEEITYPETRPNRIYIHIPQKISPERYPPPQPQAGTDTIMTRKDSSEYVLERLDDVSSVDQTRVENAAAWRSSLSVQQYVEREAILNMAKIASSETNRILVFGLKAVTDPDTVLSSIELLVRKAWRFHKNADGSISRKSVLCGCIGAVFTNPGNRGQGLASIMVTKLMEIAKSPAVLGEDGFVFLYSEVGEYYARNGFKSFHVPLVNIPLSQNGLPYKKPANVELIRYHDFTASFEDYNAHIERDLREKVVVDGLDRLTIDPTSDYVDWFHLRLKYVASRLYAESHVELDVTKDSYEDLVVKFDAIEPHYYGLKLLCGETGATLGFVVWHYEYDFDTKAQRRKNYLTIVNIHVDTTRAKYNEVAFQLISEVKAYFEADHGVPQLSKFEKIVIWESEITPELVQKLRVQFGSTDGLKNSSLSAVCCIDKEDDAKLKDGSIIWENNTKLPWF